MKKTQTAQFSFYALLAALCCMLTIACDVTNKDSSESSNTTTDRTQEADVVVVKQLIEDAFQVIWSDLDTGRILDFHTEDFMLLENGVVWNNDSIRYYLAQEQLTKEEYQYERTNKFKFLDARHNGESIWVAYENYGSWATGERLLNILQWMESVVAVRQDSTWKIELLHSTRMEN